MIVRLMILTVLEVLAFAGALVAYLQRIVSTLERIGGKADSYLAKIAFGVRAIEKETSHLAPQVTQLNQSLVTLAGKLGAVDDHLSAVADALSPDSDTPAQEGAT
jgi:hypothetical protein